MFQRNEVLRQHQWPALLLVALWTAGGMWWQKATNNCFFSSSSSITENLKKTTLTKQTETPTHTQTPPQKMPNLPSHISLLASNPPPDKRRWKKYQKKIYLIIKMIFLEQSVCLSSGLLLLDNEANVLLYLPKLSITNLEYLKKCLFCRKTFIHHLPILDTWVSEELCKTFSIKENTSGYPVCLVVMFQSQIWHYKQHSTEIWFFLMYMKYSTLFSIQVCHHRFIILVVGLL